MNIIEAVKEVFNLYKNFNKKIEEEEMKENEWYKHNSYGKNQIL